MAIAVVAAFAAIAPSMASADVTPTATAVFGSNVPGAHGDYTITHNYSYTGVPSGAAGTSGDDLKQWIVDSPAGLVGNPNAVPAASRCDLSAFQAAAAAPTTTVWATVCPGYNASPAVVGDAQLVLGVDASGATATTLNGFIFVLSGTPEVPTKLGTIFPTSMPGGTTATYSISTIAPVTSGAQGDFRLRTVSDAPINRPIVAAGPTYGNIKGIVQHLYGHVNNDPAKPAFLTNPTRCDDWRSFLYAQAYDTNTNAAFLPTGTTINGGTTSGLYAETEATATTPNCANKPPLETTATSSISSGVRGGNPSLDVTLSNPNAPGVDLPKTVVTTLPGSLAVDIDAIGIGQVCPTEARDTDTCPAASKVGTVSVESPLIVAGLTGDVYITKGAQAGLPDLAIFVRGAVNFRVDGINHYTGSTGNQIQTTLTNLPQNPFTKFSVHINGGAANSLLTVRTCSTTTNASPEDGPIGYSIAGYTGASVTSSSPVVFNGCYGTPKVKSVRKCVKSKLAITPRNVLNVANVAKISLQTSKYKNKRFRYLKTDKSSPFKFSVKLSKKSYKRHHKYYYRVRSVYKPTVDAPKGKIVYSKASTFRTCK